jgi:parvulin-like peptidyl-prolyl isomerase
MRQAARFILAAAAAVAFALPMIAQQAGQTQTPAPKAAPVPTGVAATVNGQPIAELAVQRGLKRVPPAKQTEARAEIIEYLVDNALVEQNLQQRGIAIEKKEVDSMIDKIKGEITKQNEVTKQKHTFEEFMKELMLGEDELRAQITADLRWEKFVNQQADDKTLKTFFDGNKDMFDGSMVRARHILVTPKPGDAQDAEKAQQQLAALKKQIEDQAAASVAKLPATTDPLEKEKARVKVIDEAFAAAAKDKSACPSKEKGGDIGMFPRAGSMVEPFAKAAFALKPYQISDVVKTQFGYHLILATERKAGTEMPFDKVKDDVKEVYAMRLRETLTGQLRPKAQITINPAPKP